MECIIKRRVINIVCKALMNNVCENVNDNTRNRNKLLKLPRVKLKFAKRSFQYMGAILYNDLPVNVRACESYLCSFILPVHIGLLIGFALFFFLVCIFSIYELTFIDILKILLFFFFFLLILFLTYSIAVDVFLLKCVYMYIFVYR